MSTCITTDVFCDLCPEWVHGCTGMKKDAHLARRVAKHTHEWTRRRIFARTLDLCPACSTLTDRMILELL